MTSTAIDEITGLRQIWQNTPRFVKNPPRKDNDGNVVDKNGAMARIDLVRKKRLVVPSVTYADNQGSLNNDHWAYRVSYAFRDALDIRFEEKKRSTAIRDESGQAIKDENGKVLKRTSYYSEWTQGCLLGFSVGDFFDSAQGYPALQVQLARPMRWDCDIGKMDEGGVNYVWFFDPSVGASVSQLDFLRILIYGEKSLSFDVWREAQGYVS